MPFVEVSSGVRLHYEVTYCEGDAQQAALRPWLMIIHPLLMDSSYLKTLINEPILHKSFNRIAFDARHHGRSQCPPSKAIDLYTLAADFAIGLEKLQIPAVHALGSHTWASEIILRMAGLFPSKIISLCLCSVLPPILESYLERAFRECFEYCAAPQSVEEWDEAIGAVQWFNFGDPSRVEVDTLDEWAGVAIRRYSPSQALDCCLCVWPFLGACKIEQTDTIPSGLKSAITQPILILRGDNDEIFTAAGTQARLDELPPHPNHRIVTLRDAPLLLCKTHIDEVRFHYMDWVNPLLEGKPNQNVPKPSVRSSGLKSSLEKLAFHWNDDSIGKRDPCESSSYYRSTKEELDLYQDTIEQLAKNQNATFSLFGGGAPEIWTDAPFQDIIPFRFSSRFDDARLVSPAAVLSHPKHECEVEAIQIKTLVEVQYQDLIGL